MKNWSSVCITRQLAIGSHDWLASGDSSECITRVEHAGSWRVRTARSLQDKKYDLAILLSGDGNSRLILVAKWVAGAPWLLKNDFSHSFSYPTINSLIPIKCRALSERILRDKPLRTTRLTSHNLIHLILEILLLSLSPLSYPWEDLKSNPYLTIFITVRRFLVFGKQFKRESIHFGWCNGLIAGSDKVEKTRLGIILLE